MSMDLGNELKRILLAGIGAVAITAEKADEIIGELVKKGEITVAQGKDLMEDMRRKVHAATADPSSPVDVENLTPEQRQELKRKLDEMEQKPQSEPEGGACGDCCCGSGECGCEEHKD